MNKTIAAILSTALATSSLAAIGDGQQTVRFGVCADVHREILHDVDLRLRTFVREMNSREVDWIIQLGDFCQPQPFNEPFLDIWNSFQGPAYHVLGNHDMDNHMNGRFSRDVTVEFFGMPYRYYSFDKKGYRFIVLDANDKRHGYIGGEQREWLMEQLRTSPFPAVLFSHHSLEWGIENAREIRGILEEANRRSDRKKVIAVFSGHHHIDHASLINGIYHVHVNSMSYNFLGTDFIYEGRYGRRIDIRFHKIRETAPYKDPLYAVVAIGRDGTIRIEGTESEWVGPSPQELGYDRQPDNMMVPRIRSRVLPQPPVRVILNPKDQEVEVGGTAVFEVEVRAVRPVEYQWHYTPSPGLPFTSREIEGATGPRLVINGTALEDGGFYFCRILETDRDADYWLQTGEAQLIFRNAPSWIGHWKLDETDPGALQVLNSAPGMRETGTRDETIMVNQPAPVGRAYRFSGSAHEDQVILGERLINQIVSTDSLTVMAWIRPDFIRPGTGADSRQCIMATNAHFQFTLSNEGQLQLHFRDGSLRSQNLVQWSGAATGLRVRAGEWSHVAATREGSRGRLFINGAVVAEDDSLTSENFNMTGDVLRLGRERPGRTFDGLMTDVGLWAGEALTEREIAITASLGRIGFGLDSKKEISGLLKLFERRGGTLVTGGWQWSHTNDFAAPLDGEEAIPGMHYFGVDGNLYVFLGHGYGRPEGLSAAKIP